MADMLAPLYAILGKEVEWTWSDKEHQAFEVTHYGLVIGHLNSDLPVLLMCDASSYGIGIVLAHRIPDSSENQLGMFLDHYRKLNATTLR